MGRRDEALLGKIALRDGFLTAAQIEECVRIQEEESVYRPLGALLIEKGYLEPRTLHAILQKQQQDAPPVERLERKRENDRIFSKICLTRNLLTFDQVNECLKLQTRKQKKGVFIPLSRLLIQKGYLTVDHVREVYKIQYGVVFFCPSCAVSYQIPDYSEEKAYPCPKCGAVLEFQNIQSEATSADARASECGLDPVTTIGGEARFGHYRVISELGRGAMGLVYRVYDEVGRREVALKILPGGAGLNADTVERFKREAEAIRGLEHPGIIPIFDVGVEGGTHYYTMKYVKGTSLDILIDGERIEPVEACRMIIQAAEALEVAHRNGIVHRDIKPENLILDSETGRVVVTDFGLAKAERSATLTASEAIVGTPCYMSPEQARGKKSLLNHRTDVYSLGATLYELLTFQLPFEGDDVQDILRRVVDDDPEPPRKINPKIHRDLEAIVLKAMAKNPKRRYQSMREFAGDLKLFQRGRKVRAKPLGPFDRLYHLVYRHREVVVVFLLVQTLILSGGLFVLYRMRQKQFKEIVETERGRADEADARVRALAGEVESLRAEVAMRPGTAPLAVHPVDPVEPILAEARAARRLGDGDRAWTLWRRAHEIDRDSWRLWLFRGETYLREGDAARAAEDFARAVDLAPGRVEPRRELARARFALGRWAEALAEADRCLASEAEDPCALAVRVGALGRTGRADEARAAREVFDRAAATCRARDAGDRRERFALEEIRIEAAGEPAPGRWTALAGTGDTDLVLAVDPSEFPPRIGAWIALRSADVHARRADWARESDTIARGLAIDRDHPVLLFRRGTLADLVRAIEVAGRYVAPRVALAWAMADRGLFEEACGNLRALERIAPDHPDLPALRARLKPGA